MRATEIYVILEFLALVHILAGLLVLFQSEAQRTGTDSLLGAFLVVTMMRTISVVLLAPIDQLASLIIVL